MLKPQAGHVVLALLDPLRQGTAETSGLGAGRDQAGAGLCPCLSGPRVQKWTDMKGLPGRAHMARPLPHPWATNTNHHGLGFRGFVSAPGPPVMNPTALNQGGPSWSLPVICERDALQGRTSMGMVAGTTHVGSISSAPPSPRSDRRTAPGPSPAPPTATPSARGTEITGNRK